MSLQMPMNIPGAKAPSAKFSQLAVAGSATPAYRLDAARVAVQRGNGCDQIPPFRTFFTFVPASTTFPQNLMTRHAGERSKRHGRGESFMNMRLMSLPHTPQSLVFIFTHSGEGRKAPEFQQALPSRTDPGSRTFCSTDGEHEAPQKQGSRLSSMLSLIAPRHPPPSDVCTVLFHF